MKNEELERIDALLKASRLTGRHIDVENDVEPNTHSIYDVTTLLPLAESFGDPAIGAFFAAAPAAIDALLAEVNRLRNELQARMVLGGGFDL